MTAIPYHPPAPPDGRPVTAALAAEALGSPPDLNIRAVLIGGQERFPADALFIDGLVNGQLVSDIVIRSLNISPGLRGARSKDALFEQMETGAVHNHTVKRVGTVGDAVAQLISGSIVVVPRGENAAFCYEVKGFPQRGIGEPSGENVMKGARDAFIENVRFNTALLRRKIHSPALRFTEMVVGRQTLTTVSVAYMEGLTNTGLVAECERRLREMDIDGVVLAAQIEEYLSDHKYTPFPQMFYTERVDKAARALTQGRVVLLIDGMPVTYILPSALADFMKAPEDYSFHAIVATIVTVLRYFALVIAIALPAFYLAIVTFHPELFPTTLIMTIIKNKKNVPFPSVLELLIMLTCFEILLESSMRMPQNIGSAVSIVGALVIGQAAVEASLVTSAVVIVIALAGIAGFTLPNQDFSFAVRLWRFLMVMGAALAGFFGISMVGCLLLAHLARLQSFGMSYLLPFTGESVLKGIGAGLVRRPVWMEKNRPDILHPKNIRSQK